MEYILIGILSIVVWGLRATVKDMYDRVYRLEKTMRFFQYKGKDLISYVEGKDNEFI